MENNKKIESVNEVKEVKSRRTLNTKYYRAFLVYCYDLQSSQLTKLDKELDELHNLLRKNSNSHSAGKRIRLAIVNQQNAIKETKSRIKDIQLSVAILDQFEHLNGISYKLSEEFIAEEGKKYVAEEKAEEGHEKN